MKGLSRATLAWRMLARDLRSGEVRVLLIALTIAVAAVSGVGFFTDRVQQAMARQGAELLAADLVVRSSHPLPDTWGLEAQRRGLAMAWTITFPTVLFQGEASQLAQVKAASPAYPLRGQVRVAPVPFGPDEVVAAGPRPGTAWAEPRLLASLGLQVGDTITLGRHDVRVTRVITYEPDRGGDLFQVAPRLMLALDDLAATELVGPHSRARYRLLVAGAPTAVEHFRTWIGPRLRSGDRVEGLAQARPEFRVALDRAERFLGLAALSAVLLAGAAIALAAHRFRAQQSDTAALLRCLGAPQRVILGLYGARLLGLGLLAAVAGVGLGFAIQGLLTLVFTGYFAAALPAPSLEPAIAALLTALTALAAFALPAVIRLGQVPPLRVLRRDLGAPSLGAGITGVAALVGLAALIFWQADDARLASLVLGGTVVAVGGFAAATWLLVLGAGRLRAMGTWGWRVGAANLARRPGVSVLQVVAFALGLTVVLLLAVVRVDLLDIWRDTLPPDAPNLFLVNVQPDEVAELERFIASRGLPAPEFFPMVRARLVAVNDAPVQGDDYVDPEARRFAERDFNLSTAQGLSSTNRLVAGIWWDAATPSDAFSVEEGIAETLGWRVGDTLSFAVADTPLTGRIASLRRVDWDSFEVNFFVLVRPDRLDAATASYVTSFRLPEERPQLLRELMDRFPTVTPIDVSAIMTQVRTLMDRASLAVQSVFLLTLVAGLTVFVAAFQASRGERLREVALLRSFGASRRQVLTVVTAEFLIMGALAGLVASIAAAALGAVLAGMVFELPYHPSWDLWLLGFAASIGIIGGLGLWLARDVLRKPPLRSLAAE